MAGSSTIVGPARMKRSAVLEEKSPILGWFLGGIFLVEIALEAVKELLPDAGLGDEDIPPIRFVANAPEIAQRAERIQGACDHRLGDPKQVRQSPHSMRSRCQVDEHHQRHLTVGEIWLPRADIGNQ